MGRSHAACSKSPKRWESEMDEKTFADKCAAYQANSDIHRTYIHAFIGFVVAIGVLWAVVMAATEADKHYAEQALATQESSVKW